MSEKDKIINYTFFHWGPFLYKTKLTDEETSKIKKLCKKDKKKDCRKTLVGLVENEYSIDQKKLFPIILSYVESYVKASYEHWGIILGNKITLESSWVNYMTKFESNPMHTHSGDLSFVIYTNIPEELKKENEKTMSNKTNGGPGAINFIYSIDDNKFSISQKHFFPEVNDIFIFPAILNHSVNHFQSEGERTSISGNLIIK